MAYKIGIVTKNLNFYKLLSMQRKSDLTYELEFVKSIDSLKQLSNLGKIISSFVFDSSHSPEEIIAFGEYIKNSRRYQAALIFLAFDNFETFEAITTKDSFSNAKLINMPTPAAEIYKKMTTETSQVDHLEKNDIQKAKNQKAISSASFLNIFIEATMATIKEMTACEDISHSNPSLLDYGKMEHEIAIRGKLAITSPYFNGSFFISFPESTFLKLSSVVLYEEVTKIDKDNEDLVSELCNIVYGKSKVVISGLDMKLGMVIPTYNRDKKINHEANILIVKFTSTMGDFYVKVAPGLI